MLIMKVWQLTSLTDKKTIPKFVDKTQVMIENNSSNQIHCQGHGNVWVSYLAGSAWRIGIFYKNEKRPIFITGH